MAYTNIIALSSHEAELLGPLYSTFKCNGGFAINAKRMWFAPKKILGKYKSKYETHHHTILTRKILEEETINYSCCAYCYYNKPVLKIPKEDLFPVLIANLECGCDENVECFEKYRYKNKDNYLAFDIFEIDERTGETMRMGGDDNVFTVTHPNYFNLEVICAKKKANYIVAFTVITSEAVKQGGTIYVQTIDHNAEKKPKFGESSISEINSSNLTSFNSSPDCDDKKETPFSICELYESEQNVYTDTSTSLCYDFTTKKRDEKAHHDIEFKILICDIHDSDYFDNSDFGVGKENFFNIKIKFVLDDSYDKDKDKEKKVEKIESFEVIEV